MRENIPSLTKRILRQEAGFGCCFCGHPFIEYHHIIPYSKQKHMNVKDMMAVCGNCHHLCTTNAISEFEQRKHKINPKNIKDKQLRGLLYTNNNDLKVLLGGGSATNTPNLLSVKNKPILSAKKSIDGRILISAIIQNSNGQIIGQLINNEWLGNPMNIWDFEAYPKHVIVRSEANKITFSIDCRKNTVKLSGEWFLGDHKISFTPSKCKIGTNTLQGMAVKDCYSFINIG